MVLNLNMVFKTMYSMNKHKNSQYIKIILFVVFVLEPSHAAEVESVYYRDRFVVANKSIAKNVDPGTFERLRSRIDYHNSLYENVRTGDRYSLTYAQGKGTELALNGEPKGIIEGADFAAAVFSIWLGPKPISKSFKRQVLGR